MICYKLTNADDRTHGGCQWGEGVTHETNGSGELCGPGWIHAYSDPLLAVLLNPIHASFQSPHLWKCEASGEIKDDHGLKLGTTKLTTLKRMKLPAVTKEQRVRFGILCAMEVCKDKAWRTWATNWLSGADRSPARAKAAWAEVAEAAWAAGWAAWAAGAEALVAEVAEAAKAAAEAVEGKIDLVALARRAMEVPK